MFNTYDEYERATREAQVNKYEEEKTSYTKLILFNTVLFVAFSILVYFGFHYFKGEESFFTKTKVLGVSYINPKYAQNDEELIHILDDMDIDVLDSQRQLSQEMRSAVVSENATESSYEKALKEELESEPLVIIVKEGDTLRSLAEQYYGDIAVFHKILDANPTLSEQSNKVYIGQKLILP